MDNEVIIFSVASVVLGFLFIYFAYDTAINKNIAMHTELNTFTINLRKNKRKIVEKIALMNVTLGFLYFVLPIVSFAGTLYWMIYFIFLTVISIIFFIKIYKDLRKLK